MPATRTDKLIAQIQRTIDAAIEAKRLELVAPLAKQLTEMFTENKRVRKPYPKRDPRKPGAPRISTVADLLVGPDKV